MPNTYISSSPIWAQPACSSWGSWIPRFFFMPLGNDLLIVGLTSQHHERLYYYVPLAALGSALGVLLLDLVARKGGEERLKNHVTPKRLEYLKRKVSQNASLALVVAALAPPPFPFTPVVAAASAFAYPRPKLLAVIFAARVVRFTIIGLLAIWFGRYILTVAKTPGFAWGMAAFLALCFIGSGMSIYKWVAKSRRAAAV